MKRIVRSSLLLVAMACVLVGCPGDGSDGPGPVVRVSSTAGCLTIAPGHPSGFTKAIGSTTDALVVRFDELSLYRIDLQGEAPRQLNTPPPLPEVPASCPSGIDSDSDGRGDEDWYLNQGFGKFGGCIGKVASGQVLAISENRVAVTTSNIEQILFLDAHSGELRNIQLDTPASSPSFDPADWPFWPAFGDRPYRTAFSTLTCINEPGLVDSSGLPAPPFLRCDPTVEGFSTNFTADVALSASRFFVATSNWVGQGRFLPGTVLVFDYDTSISPPRVSPHETSAVIRTTAYNATSITPYTTPSGRELLLVGLTGSILPDGSAVVTDSAIDVIDANSLTLIATIPLGAAGLGFGRLAIDPTQRIALAGSTIRRALYAIDLAALDDPMLGLGPQTLPIILDGMTPGFRDARVYSDANPFVLPKRSDGPLDTRCFSNTSVAIKNNGSFVAASDKCDGTITRLELSLPGARTDTIDPFSVLHSPELLVVAAPFDANGETRDIDRVLLRDGVPGIDFTGPDLHYIAGQESGAACAFRVDAR